MFNEVRKGSGKVGIRPGSTRGAGLAAQTFALLGTLFGIFHDRDWRRSPHSARYRLARRHGSRTNIRSDPHRAREKVESDPDARSII
jgi:hypothetical protein